MGFLNSPSPCAQTTTHPSENLAAVLGSYSSLLLRTLLYSLKGSTLRGQTVNIGWFLTQQQIFKNLVGGRRFERPGPDPSISQPPDLQSGEGKAALMSRGARKRDRTADARRFKPPLYL